MKILFSSGTLYRWPLKEIFLLAREAGFDGCDLVINSSLDGPRFKETIEEALAILPAYSLHVPVTKLRLWGTPVRALIRCVETARELGIQVVNFHPPSWFHHELSFYRWFRKVDDFQKELDCGDVFVAIENMPLIGKRLKLAPYVLNDYKDLIEFGIARNLYFTFDITHARTFLCDTVVSFLGFYKTERLKNVHLSDSTSESHLFPGTGTQPIARLLNTMRKVGYDGMVTLEVAPQELPVTREWLLRVLRYAASFMRLHLSTDEHGPFQEGHGQA
jgi:sugar phosphate isomerase/epimerase